MAHLQRNSQLRLQSRIRTPEPKVDHDLKTKKKVAHKEKKSKSPGSGRKNSGKSSTSRKQIPKATVHASTHSFQPTGPNPKLKPIKKTSKNGA